MGNCLKTQLKESVNNDNLMIYDSVVITMKTEQDPNVLRYFILSAVAGKTLKVEVLGEGYICTDNVSFDKKVIEGIEENYIFFTNTEDVTIKISSKYDIKTIDFSNSGHGNAGVLNIDALAYTPIETFNFGGCVNCRGNVSSLDSTLITTLWIGSGVVGSVEDFVATQIRKGRTSPSSPIDFGYSASNVPFGNSTYLLGGEFLTWTENSIYVFCGGSSVSDYTTVLEKGATPEEIATWRAAGKLVIDVVTGTEYPPTNV